MNNVTMKMPQQPRFYLVSTLILLANLLYAQLSITCERVKPVYNLGETAVFKIASSATGMATVDFFYDSRDNRSILKTENIQLTANQPQSVSLRLNESGVVFCKLTQNSQVAFATSAFSPTAIQPFEPEPADFDAFWQQKKSELAAIPIRATLTPFGMKNGLTIYKLTLPSVNGRVAGAYLTIPAGTGPFPAVIKLPPFGDAPLPPDELNHTEIAEKGNAISVTMSAHSTTPDQLDPLAYKPDITTNPDSIYNKLMVLNCLRIIDYLFTRFDFNGSLGIVGESQGGGLAITVGGLDKRVKAVAASNPAFCQLQAYKSHKASGFPTYLLTANQIGLNAERVSAAIKYHDVVYFAKRFKGVLYVTNGYEDLVTPAATVFAAANQHFGQTIVCNMKKTGHNHPWNEYWIGRFAFFAQHLEGFQNPYPNLKKLHINITADTVINLNQSITLQSVVFDGNQVAFNLTGKWEKIAGAGQVTFSNPNDRQTSASFSTHGTYILRFMAEDDYTIQTPDAKFFTIAHHLTVKVRNPLAVNDLLMDKDWLEIFPNPVLHELNVKFKNKFTCKSLKITDLSGKIYKNQVPEKDESEVLLELSKLPRGLYLLKAENIDGGMITKKFTKM
ncbi:MAG: Acetyl esterase Axe7A precursor [Bacteroidota bacterium]|jgi:cephalosporin-C deacetylase-like acetyl esterase